MCAITQTCGAFVKGKVGLVELETLRAGVDAGEIETVVLALTDMQGRLQGKRLTARYFLDEVLGHGAEGLQLPARRRRRDEHRRRLCDVLLGEGLRRLRDAPRPRDPADRAVGDGDGDVPGRPRLGGWRRRGRLAASDPAGAACAARGARLDGQRLDRARVPRVPRQLRAGLEARATASSSPRTSTTSTTRCSAPRASSR